MTTKEPFTSNDGRTNFAKSREGSLEIQEISIIGGDSMRSSSVPTEINEPEGPLTL